MKKLILAAALAAIGPAFADAAYTQEMTDMLARARVYVTNNVRAELSGYSISGVVVSNDAFRAELDQILAAKPPLRVMRSLKVKELMPLTFAAGKVYYAQSRPHLIARAEDPVGYLVRPVEDQIAWRVEAFHPRAQTDAEKFRKILGIQFGRLIVRHLRKQGKAVTTMNGVNPVKVEADRISAALNAPRFEGLNAILAEYGIEATFDADALGIPSVADAEQLAEKMMSGEIKRPDIYFGKLSVALGVEAFNAFTERYNGGTR